MGKIRLLVVDDSPFIYKAVARALDNSWYEICGVGKNGEEGVALYEALKPDVVTMDITMPIMDGFYASKEIIAKDENARIIMLSAMGDEEIIERAREIGIQVFLQKPFKKDDLIGAIQSVCQG
jgi:two-component system chemotaxis response regulator CheY